MQSPAIMMVLVILAAAFPRAAAAQPNLAGVVFVDRNANGARDAGEAGLAGVSVSDQNVVVVTGTDGSFRIPHSLGSGVVYVSVPDGYRAVGRFWRTADSAAAERGFSFPLAPLAPPAEFIFIHASDTHISPASLGRTQRLRAIVDSVKPAFVLITGDLVRDALRVPEAEAKGYYDLFQGEKDKFSVPVWTVPGNHENFGIERHLSLVSPEHPLYARGMYHHYLGPDYYSFTYGGVHFVGLNTVDIDDLWYYGHVDSVQVEWLRRDLAAVPAGVPIVTFNHIPFFSAGALLDGLIDAPASRSIVEINGRLVFRHVVTNAADVLRVLRTRRHVLALGGHLHLRERLRFEIDGVQTRFEQAAAIVGPRSNANQSLNFRSGITVYRVKGTDIDEGEFVSLEEKPQ